MTNLINIIFDLEELRDLSTKLSNCILLDEPDCTISEFINFPKLVEDTLDNILIDLEKLKESEESEELEELQEPTRILSCDVEEIAGSGEDMCFQWIDESWAKELHLPEKFYNKSVATYKYIANVEEFFSDGTTKTVKRDYYNFCLDPGEKTGMSSDDVWYTVNNSDIVFQNNYCKIFKPDI